MSANTYMKPRLHYFDVLKGLAIFAVVMGHVLGMCVRGIDSAPIFKVIGEIHMPLFFFISGWFVMRLSADGSPRRPALLPRAKRLLLPMVAVSSLWIWYYPVSGLESPFTATFDGLWSAEWKDGYWFTLVLFEITAVYALIAPWLGRRPSFVRECAIAAAAWAVMEACVLLLPEKVTAYTSLGIAADFFPAFAYGAIACRHADAFGRLCSDSRIVTGAMLIGAFCLIYTRWYWNFPVSNTFLIRGSAIILRFCLVIVAIAAVRPWCEKAFAASAPEGSHRWAHMWEYIGKRSLAIYLLHYFFLFPLGGIRDLLLAVNLNFVPLAAVSAAVAAAVVAVVLAADYVLNFSGLLGLLLTGTEAPKTKTSK